jgi:hypothetical protein
MPINRIFLAFLFFVSASSAAEVHTVSGKVLTGDLLSLTDKQVILGGTNGRTITPLSEVLLVDIQRESALPSGKYSDVELTDGTLLHCSRFTLKGKEVELKLASSEQVIKLPLGTVSYVLNNAEDATTRQDWGKILAKKGNQDILAVKSNGTLNALDVTFGDGNEKGEIAFERESGGTRKKREVDPARLQGMVFVRGPNPDAPPQLCKIQDVNQNLLVAAKLELTAHGLVVVTVSGLKIELAKTTLCRLDFNNGKVVYLSDLKPVEMIIKSRQGRKETVHIDKNLENSAIKLEETVYGKGLAIHSHTELVYALDGKYRHLEAVLGMDVMVGGNGQPVVKIEGDGKELFSATVTRATKSQKLDVDVKGVKQLRVIVTSSGIFDFGDHVDLADAKLGR